ncbi:hypothetical protein [Bifidobacterium cuniculi]|uniref:Uncharacterized protein n=1 Tax=Bifidobacterium cuniculi TaxID=1688 RepID=A0A087B3X5_9BIFI|nr:hypothetical protein [Bifidobacterium cuniculi]KFI65725.1 hypothetical protein BCUN_0220 [Bifidobacterium cuniculi]
MDALTIANLAISAVGALGGITGIVALLQSRRANQIANKALARDTEVSTADFSMTWNEIRGGVVFTNIGADDAIDVVVLVNRDRLSSRIPELRKVIRAAVVKCGETILVELPEIVAEKNEMTHFFSETPLGGYMALAGRHYETRLSCDVFWHTGHGFAKSRHKDVIVK